MQIACEPSQQKKAFIFSPVMWSGGGWCNWFRCGLVNASMLSSSPAYTNTMERVQIVKKINIHMPPAYSNIMEKIRQRFGGGVAAPNQTSSLLYIYNESLYEIT